MLMDLVMPGMNGLEATRRIKTQSGAPRVVILTLHDDLEYRAATKAAGADGFIAKSEFCTEVLPSTHRLFTNSPRTATEEQGSDGGDNYGGKL